MNEVYGLINQELVAQGVTELFGLPGEDTIEWIASLAEVGITYRGTRHEGAAVSMADGYSWAGERLGVCTATRGPGLTNTLSALREAVAGRRRVLLVVGNAPVVEREAVRQTNPAARKNIDQRPLVEGVGAAYFQVGSPDMVLIELRRAIASAMGGRPAVFAIPTDIFTRDRGKLAYAPALPAPDRRNCWSVASRDIETITGLIAAAKHPLILAGAGAIAPDCRDQLAQLAGDIGALLGTTLLAKGAFAGSDYNLGVVGGFAADPAAPLLARVDLVLAFGASLNLFTTASQTLFRGAKIVQVDADPAALGASLITLGLVCDSLVAARHIHAALPAAVKARAKPFHEAAVLRQLTLPPWAGPDEGEDGELDPRAVMVALDRVLPKGRVAIIEGGQMATSPGRFLPVQTPRGVRNSAQSGSLGLGLGVALGAALGRPDRPCVLFAGDGGFSMALADLETAHRHAIPLIMVILNDNAYTAEFYVLRGANKPPQAADIPNMHFAAIARAMGIEAITIDTAAQLASLDPAQFRRDTPLVVDCHIRRELVVPRLEWK